MLGVEGTRAHIEEARRSVGRLFTALARRRPLVVIFDDVHWAQPGLVRPDHSNSELARKAPLLVICIARPELLDAHPDWGGDANGHA